VEALLTDHASSRRCSTSPTKAALSSGRRSIRSSRAFCSSGEEAERLSGFAKASVTAAASETRLFADIVSYVSVLEVDGRKVRGSQMKKRCNDGVRTA
jgi:hypothetical protein